MLFSRSTGQREDNTITNKRYVSEELLKSNKYTKENSQFSNINVSEILRLNNMIYFDVLHDPTRFCSIRYTVRTNNAYYRILLLSGHTNHVCDYIIPN